MRVVGLHRYRGSCPFPCSPGEHIGRRGRCTHGDEEPLPRFTDRTQNRQQDNINNGTTTYWTPRRPTGLALGVVVIIPGDGE